MNNATNNNNAVQTPPKPAKAKKPRLTRKEKDSIMASLGLTKVRGAVSGRIYYE